MDQGTAQSADIDFLRRLLSALDLALVVYPSGLHKEDHYQRDARARIVCKRRDCVFWGLKHRGKVVVEPVTLGDVEDAFLGKDRCTHVMTAVTVPQIALDCSSQEPFSIKLERSPFAEMACREEMEVWLDLHGMM